ncbi:unnamed protein product [Durusdinium trenchii]|uniref:Uncharacterized protein n=1 Tax=Durusdinium trenchii TaxID=1381693 RepID=A0ABP0QRT8_9DINO
MLRRTVEIQVMEGRCRFLFSTCFPALKEIHPSFVCLQGPTKHCLSLVGQLASLSAIEHSQGCLSMYAAPRKDARAPQVLLIFLPLHCTPQSVQESMLNTPAFCSEEATGAEQAKDG